MDWYAWLGLGMVIGFAVAWWATWYRLARIESDLRHIANEAAQYREFTGVTMPAEWIADQVEWLRNRNF